MRIFSWLNWRKDPEKLTEDIMWLVAKKSFSKFREKPFRQKLDFEKIGQTEQDRVFNELVATGLSLCYLTFETLEQENPHQESKGLFRIIRNQIVSVYVRQLRAGNIEDDLADLWYQLVAMRCEEYRKDFLQNQKEFDVGKENPWSAITAIGGVHHLRRGKTSAQDPLLPEISRWCGELSLEMQKMIVKNC